MNWQKRKHFLINSEDTKGQIISKGLFGVLEFLQKRTNKFIKVVKTNSFVHFLGEFEDKVEMFLEEREVAFLS